MSSQVKAEDFWDSVDTFREVLLREQKVKHVVQSCAVREVAGHAGASSAASRTDHGLGLGLDNQDR